MTAAQILDIKEPGLIFSGEINKAKSEYNHLVKIWHPDVSKDPRANEVFVHIKLLYETAMEMINTGTWQVPGLIQFNDMSSGVKYRIKYHKHHKFELGDFYINDTVVMYVLESKYRALVENAKMIFKGFKFSSDRMEKETRRYLPEITKIFETTDKICVVVKKTEDLLLLQDVYEKLDTIPNRDRHVAWVISTIYNLCCYLEYTGVCHNAISLDTYFISPKYHSGVLLGGWWYASIVGNKMKALPPKTYNLLPPDILISKISDHKVDQELIKLVGRELLEDKTGIKLIGMKIAPSAFINWLKCASNGKSVDNYKTWDKVLEESFGKKRFVTMDLDAIKLYGERSDNEKDDQAIIP